MLKLCQFWVTECSDSGGSSDATTSVQSVSRPCAEGALAPRRSAVELQVRGRVTAVLRLGDALLLRGRGLDTPGMEVTVAGRPCSRIGRQAFGRLMCYGMGWTPPTFAESHPTPRTPRLESAIEGGQQSHLVRATPFGSKTAWQPIT